MTIVSCLICKGLGQIRETTGTFFDKIAIVRCEYCKGNGEQILLEKEVTYLNGIPYMLPLQWTDNMEALNQ